MNNNVKNKNVPVTQKQEANLVPETRDLRHQRSKPAPENTHGHQIAHGVEDATLFCLLEVRVEQNSLDVQVEPR